MTKRIEYTNELPQHVKREISVQLLNHGVSLKEVTAFFESSITDVEDMLRLTEYELTRDTDEKPITIEKSKFRTRITPERFMQECKENEIDHFAMIEFINERTDVFEDTLHMRPTDNFIDKFSHESDILIDEFVEKLKDSEIDNGYSLHDEFTGFNKKSLFYGLSKEQYVDRLKRNEDKLIFELIKLIIDWDISVAEIEYVFRSRI